VGSRERRHPKTEPGETMTAIGVALLILRVTLGGVLLASRGWDLVVCEVRPQASQTPESEAAAVQSSSLPLPK
jgi:hypothetical protein